MMIKKIPKINNVFSYSFFIWDDINPEHGSNPNDPIDNFSKNNIVFAENGNGKSRLVDILKSVNGQAIVLEKNWDCLLSESQKVKIVTDTVAEIDFSDSKWSSDDLKNKFLIFDEYFIEGFVHSVGPYQIDTPQRRQERGKNIVYLGNFAKYNEEIDRINAIKNSILEENNQFLENEKAKIQGLLEGFGITLDKLLNQKDEVQNVKKEDLNSKKEKVKNQELEIIRVEKAIKEKNKISDLNILLEINVSFSMEIVQEKRESIILDPNELFSFTVCRGVQQTLRKIADKKDFIKQGLSLIDEDTEDCPFCEQKIKNGHYIQIIKDYQDIFDETFTKEEQSVKLLLVKYKKILENLRELHPPFENQAYLAKAKQFLSLDEELPQLNLTEEEIKIVKDEINLVLSKEKNILEKVEGSKVNDIKKIITKVNKSIKDYDKVVQEINGKIEQLQKDSIEGRLDTKKHEILDRIKEFKKEIFYIENKEQFINYFQTLEQYTKNEETIKSLERIYQLLKDKIIEEFNEFVSEYFDLIRSLVKELSPSMEILDIIGQASYDRRNPRDPAQCGFRIEYNGKDCSTSLSKGEKQVIALAFFFAQLKKEKDKDKIVVLDDPITSFDAGKRKSTAEVIQRETKDFQQLFVLTCDPLFREYCLKQINNRKFYYIFKTLGSSSIHHMPNNKENICSSFEADFRDIDNALGTNENVIIYGQKLRFCLETKIKEKYFGYSEDSLASMIEKVTKKGIDEFKKLFINKEAILQIYSYCNTGGLAHYPRDGSTSWNELKDKIKQYLAFQL